MARLAPQLVVVALIALVQVSVFVASSVEAASNGPTQPLEEEGLDDETLVEAVDVTTVSEHPCTRWDVEQHAPAPVHLDRESRPPSA
jgi:hypothetical protein